MARDSFLAHKHGLLLNQYNDVDEPAVVRLAEVEVEVSLCALAVNRPAAHSHPLHHSLSRLALLLLLLTFYRRCVRTRLTYQLGFVVIQKNGVV
eukprot:scaffold3296_cov159-Ochromonas_danica.AAC.17